MDRSGNRRKDGRINPNPFRNCWTNQDPGNHVRCAPQLEDPLGRTRERQNDWRKKSKRLGMWKVGMAAGRQGPPSRRRGDRGLKVVVATVGEPTGSSFRPRGRSARSSGHSIWFPWELWSVVWQERADGRRRKVRTIFSLSDLPVASAVISMKYMGNKKRTKIMGRNLTSFISRYRRNNDYREKIASLSTDNTHNYMLSK
jgi:hypothetical protein